MLEASAAKKAEESFTILDWIGVLVTSAGILFLVAWPFRIAPAFREMLRDMGGALPEVTEIALSTRFGLVPAVATLALLGVGLWPRGSLARRRALVVASFLVVLISGALFLYGAYAPIFQLASMVK